MTRALLASVLMVVAAVTAIKMTPTRHWRADSPRPDLEHVVPQTFGDWHLSLTTAASVIDPTVAKRLDDIYDQTLARTYVNDRGYQVMLSVAYGWEQSRTLQIHRPEVCYVAQGFNVSKAERVALQIGTASIPAMRMRSALGSRTEPVTYWVRIGDLIVRGNVEQGFARLRYGLRGFIADGLLFRVSSIDDDPNRAFDEQLEFIRALINEVEPSQLWVLAGRPAS
jgi:EpsI family protein